MDKTIQKMRFRKIKSFSGQHNFWLELGGLARIAIADQSVVCRDGSLYQPQWADHKLLFIDFQTIVDNDWELKESTSSGFPKYVIWGLPVVEMNGDKFTIILIEEEYNWFIKYFG